jgi:hypothetical protein
MNFTTTRILLLRSNLFPYSLALQQSKNLSLLSSSYFSERHLLHFHQNNKIFSSIDDDENGKKQYNAKLCVKGLYFYQQRNLFHSQSVLNNFAGQKIEKSDDNKENNKKTDEIEQQKESNEIVLDDKKLGIVGRFKKMAKEYWYVLIPVHVVTSMCWLGGFYYASKCGVDIVGMMEQMHISDKLINPLRDSHLGHIAVAYLLYKIATPARYTVTLGGTTFAIRFLSQRCFIRPMPSKDKLVQMYKDKKEDLQQKVADKKVEIQEKFKKD